MEGVKMAGEIGSGGPPEPWEPEYVIADLAAALARAQAFTLRCGFQVQ